MSVPLRRNVRRKVVGPTQTGPRLNGVLPGSKMHDIASPHGGRAAVDHHVSVFVGGINFKPWGSILLRPGGKLVMGIVLQRLAGRDYAL